MHEEVGEIASKYFHPLSTDALRKRQLSQLKEALKVSDDACGSLFARIYGAVPHRGLRSVRSRSEALSQRMQIGRSARGHQRGVQCVGISRAGRTDVE